MRLRSLASLAVCVLLAACASGPDVESQITTVLQQKHVSYGVYSKVSNARPLNYSDILELVKRDVPTHIITGYLQSTRKVYNFTYSQLQGLKAAGASPQLLNYLSETEGFYGNPHPRQKETLKNLQKDAYYNTPLYQDEAPFGYDEPIIDDFYDSGYVESLYSPFSYN